MTTKDAGTQPPDTAPTDPATLTIGDLGERTGLSPATLRMWESRHGFPVPQRLESGHRRYSEADVEAIQAVVRHKDSGTRLEVAIARAMAEAEPAAPSIYAFLRRRHSDLAVYRLKKSTLLALSWAIEDEFCSKADRAVLYGSFQDETFFRAAQPRWTELARVAARATVFANFAETRPTASPAEVSLRRDAPMLREWAVVCDARDLSVALTAWELPGQVDVPDSRRLFEAMWTVDASVVHDAARVCAAIASEHGVEDTHPGHSSGPRGVADLRAVTGLFNRMVSYVDWIGD